jgi:hypothetical protein
MQKPWLCLAAETWERLAQHFDRRKLKIAGGRPGAQEYRVIAAGIPILISKFGIWTKKRPANFSRGLLKSLIHNDISGGVDGTVPSLR